MAASPATRPRPPTSCLSELFPESFVLDTAMPLSFVLGIIIITFFLSFFSFLLLLCLIVHYTLICLILEILNANFWEKSLKMMPNRRPGSLCLAFSNSRERKGLNYVRQVYNIANANNSELDDNVAFLQKLGNSNVAQYFQLLRGRSKQGLAIDEPSALTKTASCSQIT